MPQQLPSVAVDFNKPCIRALSLRHCLDRRGLNQLNYSSEFFNKLKCLRYKSRVGVATPIAEKAFIFKISNRPHHSNKLAKSGLILGLEVRDSINNTPKFVDANEIDKGRSIPDLVRVKAFENCMNISFNQLLTELTSSA